MPLKTSVVLLAFCKLIPGSRVLNHFCKMWSTCCNCNKSNMSICKERFPIIVFELTADVDTNMSSLSCTDFFLHEITAAIPIGMRTQSAHLLSKSLCHVSSYSSGWKVSFADVMVDSKNRVWSNVTWCAAVGTGTLLTKYWMTKQSQFWKLECIKNGKIKVCITARAIKKLLYKAKACHCWNFTP